MRLVSGGRRGDVEFEENPILWTRPPGMPPQQQEEPTPEEQEQARRDERQSDLEQDNAARVALLADVAYLAQSICGSQDTEVHDVNTEGFTCKDKDTD